MNKGTSLYLDLVRFSAAAVVFIQHAKALSRDSFLGFWVNHPNVYSLINVLSQAAVTVFFVLSGYVIAHVLATRERTPLDYAASRFGRLYSVVIPALIVTTLCNYVLSQPHALVSGYGLRVLANLTFTNSFWLPADL